MESLLPVVIGLAAGIAMVVSFSVLIPSLPPQRQWMAIDVIQCGNLWEDFVSSRISARIVRDDPKLFQDLLKQYYSSEHNLTVYQMQQIEHPRSNDPGFYGYALCEGCGCYGGFTFATLIDATEVDRAETLRFYKLETPPRGQP